MCLFYFNYNTGIQNNINFASYTFINIKPVPLMILICLSFLFFFLVLRSVGLSEVNMRGGGILWELGWVGVVEGWGGVTNVAVCLTLMWKFKTAEGANSFMLLRWGNLVGIL